MRPAKMPNALFAAYMVGHAAGLRDLWIGLARDRTTSDTVRNQRVQFARKNNRNSIRWMRQMRAAQP